MPAFLIPLLIQLVASLPQIIQAAETAFGGGPGNGPAKKQLVLTSAGAIMDAVGTVHGTPLPDAHKVTVLNTLGSVVDSVVSVFNSIGIFTKKPAA
jgi:hypothetical protein